MRNSTLPQSPAQVDMPRQLKDLPAFENINNRSDKVDPRRASAEQILSTGWQMKGDYPPIKLDDIPWRDPLPQHRSMVFYAHSWEMLDDLLLAYSLTGEDRYILPAIEVALEWVAFAVEDDKSGVESLAWYDMAVGRRAYRLAYIVDVARRGDMIPEADLQRLMDMLDRHRRYLADDDNIVF